MKKNFKAFSKDEIRDFISKLKQKPYRAGQIIDWIYKKYAISFDEMTDLSIELREELKSNAYISNLHLLKMRVSSDGTRKFLFQLEDGETIESVLIPNTRGVRTFTLCISSQVGCALGCAFCVTGKMGFKRNLKAYEIVDQVIAVKRYLITSSSSAEQYKDNSDIQPSITNIVFMGMGEPLNNFEELAEALRNITSLMDFSKRRITVSTSGIVPKIYELASRAPYVNLAISLNATTDETRTRIMPINKKYPLKELIKACREFPLSPRRRITFEYVLLDSVNDTREDATRLVRLLKGLRSKVNLIPYNPAAVQVFNKPSESKILEFQEILQKAGIVAIVRKSMGADISAACGQLKAKYAISNE